LRVLHLTLYRQWFYMIDSGLKKEEYREIKPYWIKRLRGREYEEIHFRNGYGLNAPKMIVECKGIEERDNTFVIKLGQIKGNQFKA